MAPRMRFRFRKSVNLLPGLLKLTVSRRGVSLNGRLGIFSRSWGTRGRSTTIDMPGTAGIFWRREDRRKAIRGADEFETAFLRRRARERLWRRAGTIALVLLGLVLAARLWLHPFADCSTEGRPGVTLLVLLGSLYGGWRAAVRSSPRLAGPLGLALAFALVPVGWWLYGAFIAGALTCA